MSVIIEAIIADGLLKLSGMRNKCIGVRVDIWENAHLKGLMKNEKLINEIEKNYPKE